MRCCPSCFWDTEIRAIIETNSVEVGNCDFCKSVNTQLLNPQELADTFQVLLDVYLPAQKLEGPVPEGDLLKNVLVRDWRIFRIEQPEMVQAFLEVACSEEVLANPDLFYKPVLAECLYNPMNAEQAEIQQINWENFTSEIKHENRFFLKNTINTDLLTRLFSRHVRPYKKGKILNRGRVSDSFGYDS